MCLTGGKTWKDIPGFEGQYQVSTCGEVKSLERKVTYVKNGVLRGHTVRGRVLKPYVTPQGYSRVVVGGSLELVHRLVAKTFIPNPHNHPFVLHWDDDPRNSCVENLRWGTQADNMQDSIRNGTHFSQKVTHCPKGHEYSGDNLVGDTERLGRKCRKCNHERRRRGLSSGDARHGTATGYYNHGCRCEMCMGAMREVEGVKNPRKVPNQRCKWGHLRDQNNDYVDKSGRWHCKGCWTRRNREKASRKLQKDDGA